MPRVTRVVETALYVEDLEVSRHFYESVLGLGAMGGSERLVPMDAGRGTVLLLFRRGATTGGVSTPAGRIPPHDGSGPAHVALAIEVEDLEAWRRHLEDHGVEVESEIRWERGGVSLYVRDPDEHSVELATPGIWPVY